MIHINIILLAIILTFIIFQICELIDKITAYVEFQNFKKSVVYNDFLKHKFRKINNKVNQYYLDLSKSSPELLAKELTRSKMIRIFLDGQIDNLYKKLKEGEKLITDRPVK